jgi:hypothetical protein
MILNSTLFCYFRLHLCYRRPAYLVLIARLASFSRPVVTILRIFVVNPIGVAAPCKVLLLLSTTKPATRDWSG